MPARSTFDCDWKRHCSLCLFLSLLRRSKGMSICHLHCTYSTHTHVAQHVHLESKQRERERVVCRLACLLGGSPKKYATLLCRVLSVFGSRCFSVFISLCLCLCPSAIVPLCSFRTWSFYGIRVTQPSTLECVNFGTFYGILMLNMTAI